MKTKFEKLMVLDFEATCADRNRQPWWDIELQEIIELPVAIVDVDAREITGEWGTFVRPERQAQLTEFCTQLTSIRQRDVDPAPTMAEAVAQLTEWLSTRGITPESTLAVTCGDWDLNVMWPKQAALAGLDTPPLFTRWCNIKHVFTELTGQRKRRGMMRMLAAMGVPHEGTHHRGADDVRNIARMACRMLDQGAVFDVTGSREPTR